MLAINKIDEVIKIEKTKEFQSSFFNKARDKRYLIILDWQLNKIKSNLEAINLLVEKGFIEDAYTIFRKYLESFFLIQSVLKNPQITREYIKHEDMLSEKVRNNTNTNVVKEFVEGKPDGYLEYGYVETLIDTSETGFKYTMKSIANAGGVGDLYKWYRITSNFVHNNLTQFKINEEDLSKKLETMCNRIIKQLLETINSY